MKIEIFLQKIEAELRSIGSAIGADRVHTEAVESFLTSISREEPLLRKQAAQLLYLILGGEAIGNQGSEKRSIASRFKASQMADLYDCRICVGAITFAVENGFMEPRELSLGDGPVDRRLMLFQGNEFFTETDLLLMMKTLQLMNEN